MNKLSPNQIVLPVYAEVILDTPFSVLPYAKG